MGKYRRIPESVIAEMRNRRAAGETTVSLALAFDIDRPYVSRLLRGRFRASAPGPIAPSGARVALTPGEREEILSAIVHGVKHFGKAPSNRTLAEKLARDRFAIARTTKRAIDWVERLLANIQKGTPEECWPWTGGTTRVVTRRRDGTTLEVVRPRYMDGPNHCVSPARFLYEFATGETLTRSQRLEVTCGNRFCCNYRHQRVYVGRQAKKHS